MRVHELASKNLGDELRFYDEHKVTDIDFIDEYTPFKRLNEVHLNREVESFFITLEVFCGELENDWLSVILKEEENA